jgi:hypothetical protein
VFSTGARYLTDEQLKAESSDVIVTYIEPQPSQLPEFITPEVLARLKRELPPADLKERLAEESCDQVAAELEIDRRALFFYAVKMGVISRRRPGTSRTKGRPR